MRVNNAPNLEPATISVEAWVKMADVNSEGYILAKGASESLASSYYFYAGDGLTFNIFSEGFFSQDSGAIIRSFAGSPADGSIFDGQWHHVVGTYDGAMVRLFVDGTEIGEGTTASFDIGYDMSVSNDLFVGSYNGTFGFDGLIDEVSIFNRALSAAEVLARFNGNTGGTPLPGARVYVNLQSHAATGLAGGVFNIANVIGSAGDDILVGNGGNVLDGGAGRDLLIAGNAAGILRGGGGEDLLIAGTTAYDLDPGALAAIHAEWTRTDIDYDVRVANLTTNNGAPVPKLIADETVKSNGGGNVLSSDDTASDDGALDLFFASLDLDSADDDEEELLVAI
jgi:Ca2+-binding RTX toxin-like protein